MEEMKKGRVLVTGATGFMGTRLVRALMECGYEVRALVRDRNKASQVLPDSCELFVGDTTKPDTLAGCCDGIDIVYHLAALMGHDLPSEKAFQKFRTVNVKGTANIIRECQRAKIARFIHVSSTAAMGLLKAPVVNEEVPCNPYTPYQVTKYEGEQLVLREYRDSGFPAIVLRPSMVYGPGFKGDFLTIAKVCRTGIFPKIGSGLILSPALYITDLIRALILFADRGEFGQTYLLSSVQSYSLKETVLIISRALHKHITFLYVPVWAAEAGAWSLEKFCVLMGKHSPVTMRNIRSVVTDRVFDIDKARKLGFCQKVTLEEGLTNTIGYFKQQNYL